MGQVLHGSAKTTHATRGELQRSQASVASLAKRYRINEKTVLKWRHRQSVEDMSMGRRIAAAAFSRRSRPRRSGRHFPRIGLHQHSHREPVDGGDDGANVARALSKNAVNDAQRPLADRSRTP